MPTFVFIHISSVFLQYYEVNTWFHDEQLQIPHILWFINDLFDKMYCLSIRLYETAIRLGQLQAQFRLQIDPEEYARDNLKFGLVEVVYEWAKVTIFFFKISLFILCFCCLALSIWHALKSVGDSICRYLWAYRCSRRYDSENYS